MALRIVPVTLRDFDFFNRRAEFFPNWEDLDEDWRAMRFNNALKRFEHQMNRVRREMHHLDSAGEDLTVQNPFITDPSGNRKLSLRFDCSQFKPEEIKLKTEGNVLSIQAKHEEDSPGRKMHIEFTKNYTLPENVDPNALKSAMSSDGVLHIEAPAPAMVEAPQKDVIPIERM